MSLQEKVGSVECKSRVFKECITKGKDASNTAKWVSCNGQGSVYSGVAVLARVYVQWSSCIDQGSVYSDVGEMDDGGLSPM